MAEANDGFEGRLDKAISDLEDALLGITDEEIKSVLREKGYAADDQNEFLNFKDNLKEAVLDRLVENHQQNDDTSSSVTDPTISSEFDVSRSSRMKLGAVQKKPDLSEDIQRLLSALSMPSEDIYPCLSEDQDFSLDDLLEANPELQRPVDSSDRKQRRKITTGLGPSPFKRRRAQSFSECQNAQAHKKMIPNDRENFEQFVRRECRMQMDLITGSVRSEWVPTKPKCSPQVRYHQYKKFWERYPAPGEKPRKELRWAIRNRMANKEEPQQVSWWPEVKLPSS